MAARDVKLYLSLKKAIKEKVANPALDFNMLEVDGSLKAYDYDYIFQTARRVFPQKYNLGHSYLHGTPISNLERNDLRHLNMEYAQDIVKGWGGTDETQINKKELDSVLAEYENELTAPDEPDYLYQELNEKAEAEADKKPEPETPPPTESTPETSSSPGHPAEQSRPGTPPPPGNLTNKEIFGTKENYAKYKETNKEVRDLQARKLWDQRQRSRMTRDEWNQNKAQNKDERNERAQKLWQRRQAANQPSAPTPARSIPQPPLTSQAPRGSSSIRNMFNPSNRRKALAALLPKGAAGSGLGIPWAPFVRKLASQAVRGLVNLGSSLVRGAFNIGSRALAQLLPRVGMQAGLAAGRGLLFSAAAPLAAVAALPLLVYILIIGTFLFGWWYSSLFSNINCDKPGQMEVKKVLENPRSGQDNVNNGDQINYQIQITYIWLCDAISLPSVTITDIVPTTLEYVPSSAKSESFAAGQGPDGVYNEATRTITWNLTNVSSNDPYGVFFSVRPSQRDDGTWSVQDTWLRNQASVTYNEPVISGRTPVAPVDGNIPPTKENCNGKYRLNNPIGNYGDPTCTYTEDDLFTMLLQNDPVNAKYWFDVVIKCESSYDPNAHADHVAVGTPDAEGAWGLFQMGRGKNGQYDHGDVIWQLQTTNAITYNNNLARKWRYWACARDRW